jgi:hypothetical protein
MIVNLVASWKRGEIEQVMSASSGPKDYLKNQIWQVFEDNKAVDRVLMVRGEYSQIGPDKHMSPPFVLTVESSGKAYDMAHREVDIRWADSPEE